MKFVQLGSSHNRYTLDASSPLTVIVSAPGSTVSIGLGAAAVFCPVLGATQVVTHDTQVTLNRGDVYVCDHHAAPSAAADQRGF
ncbi:MAG TPA: hypothetical protein VF132_03130, partial [Rudaea sp.]